MLSEEEEFFDVDENHSLASSRESLDGADNSRLKKRNVRQMHQGQQETLVDRLASWWHGIVDDHHEGKEEYPLGHVNEEEELEEEEESNGVVRTKRIIEDDSQVTPGCISFLTAAQVIRAHKKFLEFKPNAGESLSRSSSLDGCNQSCSWNVPEAPTFMIRSKMYMKTKVKVPAETSIYKLIGCDIFSFETKVDHIVERIALPKAPGLGPKAMELPEEKRLPPLLVINMQLPTYTPTLFGNHDGPGYSLVYYCALPENWEPDHVNNKAALEMALRLVNDGVEQDGQNTRDRLKLLPRIVNVDEWGEKAPLSGPELRLIRNYNGKPLLMRPQLRFYLGPDRKYFEIDVDIHRYAYIARRAFYGYVPKLKPAIFENAFVVQGNDENELPEVLLAAARIYRIDFTKLAPFPVHTLGNVDTS